MSKDVIVNSQGRETRVAVVEDGKLVEIFLERPLEQRVVGNIYKGVVENVLPGMQAAFVNVGLERNTFLYVKDATLVQMNFQWRTQSGQASYHSRAGS